MRPPYHSTASEGPLTMASSGQISVRRKGVKYIVRYKMSITKIVTVLFDIDVWWWCFWVDDMQPQLVKWNTSLIHLNISCTNTVAVISRAKLERFLICHFTPLRHLTIRHLTIWHPTGPTAVAAAVASVWSAFVSCFLRLQLNRPPTGDPPNSSLLESSPLDFSDCVNWISQISCHCICVRCKFIWFCRPINQRLEDFFF